MFLDKMNYTLSELQRSGILLYSLLNELKYGNEIYNFNMRRIMSLKEFHPLQDGKVKTYPTC